MSEQFKKSTSRSSNGLNIKCCQQASPCKQNKQVPAKVSSTVSSKKFNEKLQVNYTLKSTAQTLSYEERQYAAPKTQSFDLMSYATTGLPTNNMVSLVKRAGTSETPKPTIIGPKKTVMNKQLLARMPYIFDIVDKADYEKRGYCIDPRDMAYLYIMAAERVMQNILYPLALALGTIEELKKIEIFNALVMNTEKIEQTLQAVTNIATKAQFELAIEIYRKRLRVVKPKQFSPRIIFPEAIRTQTRAVLMIKSVKDTEIPEQVKEVLRNIIKTAKFRNVKSFKPVEASVDRPSAFPDGELVNSTLALIMVQNVFNLDGLLGIRNELAHNGGDSQSMYESMVENIFEGRKEMKDFLMLNAVYTPNFNVDEY